MATVQQKQRPVAEKSPASSVRSTVTSTVSSDTSLSASLLYRKSELIQNYYDEAKRYTSKALEADKKESRMTALELYNKALGAIQSGLGMVRQSSFVNKTLVDLRGKMEKLKDQVKDRMKVLIEQEAASRKQAGSHSAIVLPSAPSESIVMADDNGRGGIAQGREGETATEADMIFSTSEGARLFSVDSSGRVSQCSTPEPLFIFKYRKRIAGQPPAFVQCGDFIYPLIPGKSPVLRRDGYKVYMFPELSGEEGGSTGLLLRSAPDSELEELDHMFNVLANLKITDGTQPDTSSSTAAADTIRTTVAPERPPPPRTKEQQEEGDKDDQQQQPSWGTSVAGTITAGVSWLSGVLSQGTEAAGGLLSKGGDKLREGIEPGEKPVEVPAPVRVGAHYAHKVSGGIVGVSDFLMVSLAKATVAVGKKVGSVVAESDMVKGRQINPHAKEAWKVTKSTVKGAGQVFVDLERSAVAVIKATGNEASKTVGHKYGEQAGTVVDDSLSTAGHVANLTATYWSWKTWGIRFVSRVGGVLAGSGDQDNTTSKTDKQTPQQ